MLKGSFCLLHKYVKLLCSHVDEILVEAHSISSNIPYRQSHIFRVVEQELPTILVPEFMTSLVLLHTRVGLHTELSKVFSVLRDFLELLDRFNKLAPNIKVEDEEDLAWPGGLGKSIIIINIRKLDKVQQSY